MFYFYLFYFIFSFSLIFWSACLCSCSILFDYMYFISVLKIVKSENKKKVGFYCRLCVPLSILTEAQSDGATTSPVSVSKILISTRRGQVKLLCVCVCLCLFWCLCLFFDKQLIDTYLYLESSCRHTSRLVLRERSKVREREREREI